MKAVIALCLVAAVYSQVPKPCQSPPQWEARELRIDREKDFGEYFRIAYDEKEQRMKYFAEVEVGSNKSYYDLLFLWQTKKMYVVDLKTKKCNISAIDRPWRPKGVHPDAKFVTEIVLGAPSIPNEHLNIEMFTANYTDEYYAGFVSYPGCAPVQTWHYSEKYGFEESHYYDLTVGIKDPDVFKIPTECQQ